MHFLFEPFFFINDGSINPLESNFDTPQKFYHAHNKIVSVSLLHKAKYSFKQLLLKEIE